ncbi:MAG: radical SAM protein [Candidatus Omnitrophica bacterium]|nr:radical SAM protein [Candidatus Omnitrophota bacterium]
MHCRFCSCSRESLRNNLQVHHYVQAVARQMRFFSSAYAGMDGDKIAFGGGTPSILDEQQLATILDAAYQAFPARGRKILFEAHPMVWSQSQLELLASRGLHRLCFGVQSMEDAVLRNISRLQTRAKVLWCIRSARKARIPYINVDFVAGLPGQTIKGLVDDLKTMTNEGVHNISLEPYASLPLMRMCAPGEDAIAFLRRRDALMGAAIKFLNGAGYYASGPCCVYSYRGQDDGHYFYEAHWRFETAVAAFGPAAKGQFPSGVFYQASPAVDPSFQAMACPQDLSDLMAHYVLVEIIGNNGLDEQDFFARFGGPLTKNCIDGLHYLHRSGLVARSRGTWKFDGNWEIDRIGEFMALSRMLFGEGRILELRKRYNESYDQRQDYGRGYISIRNQEDPFLLIQYYQKKQSKISRRHKQCDIGNRAI